MIIEKAITVFSDTDADKDGQLNAQELQHFVREMTNQSVDKVFSEKEQQQIFANLDIDSNGALTKEGKVECKNVYRARVRSHLLEYCTEG